MLTDNYFGCLSKSNQKYFQLQLTLVPMWFHFFAFYKKTEVLIFQGNSVFPSFLLGVKQCCMSQLLHIVSLCIFVPVLSAFFAFWDPACHLCSSIETKEREGLRAHERVEKNPAKVREQEKQCLLWKNDKKEAMLIQWRKKNPELMSGQKRRYYECKIGLEYLTEERDRWQLWSCWNSSGFVWS